MHQANDKLTVETDGKGLTDITTRVETWLARHSTGDGLLTLFCRHTSCSLLIQENAAPSARRDLELYFERIAPENPSDYEHGSEGPDDMPAHLRAALTQTHLAIPVTGGRTVLGTWQGIFLFEHRRAPHCREIALHYLGS